MILPLGGSMCCSQHTFTRASLDALSHVGFFGFNSLDGEVLGNKPLVGMVGRDGLLRGSNEVLLIVAVSDLVELFVKLLKLGSLAHVVLGHELGGLKGGVTTLAEEGEAIVDQGLVQENTPLAQEVSSVANNLDTTVGVVSVKTEQDLVV